MHNSSPHGVHQHSPTPSMHEEFAANAMNALVSCHEPEYRGEPLPIFERQVLYRKDTLSADQRTYFEMTHARFQNLDHQIEGVQE